MKKIIFTVTNDLSYDQRMQRICTSLANAGYSVLLIGRKLKDSIELKEELFHQKRLHCFFNTGFLFYAEYNFRLFFYLLFIKTDAICAIDLDTILACYFISAFRGKKRIYDAHELFTEMKEVIARRSIQKIWLGIEKFAVPKFAFGYTVSYSIAEEFKNCYAVNYEVIRNMPFKREVLRQSPETLRINLRSLETSQSASLPSATSKEKFILYQGAVNEARGLENLVLAMKKVDSVLHIYGDGNMFEKIKDLIQQNNLQHKILLKGKVAPQALQLITQESYIGINLVEPVGLNQLYSLANKFFDYIQARVPQVTMNFPEYKKINDAFEVALLVNTVDENEVATALNLLLNDDELYKKLKNNCVAASAELHWQQEEKKLILFYEKVFAS
ncbi:MAG: glycosyltransferase [Parafilimonas sp.]